MQYGVDEQWNIEGKRDIIERVGLSHGKFYVTSINETLVSLDVFGSSPEDKAPRPAPVVVEIDGVQYIQFKYPHLRYNIAIAPNGVKIPRPEERKKTP